MRAVRSILSVLAVAGALSAGAAALAQEGPGGAINPGRDCQTITSCSYKKGGIYRGCISTYSCRVCKFVPSSCRIGGTRGKCEKLRCTWG